MTASHDENRQTQHSLPHEYDRTRIYHRYRIRGLRDAMRNGVVSALTQLTLKFNPEGETEDIIDALVAPQADDKERLLFRFREAAAEDGRQLESSLSRVPSSRYDGFFEFSARHEERAKLVIRLFGTDLRNPVQVFRFGVFQAVSGDRDVYLVNSRAEIADAFLKRLSDNGLRVSQARIDLQRLATASTSVVRGGSFRIRGRPTLTTAIVFGPQVNEDESWEQYSSIGQLQYIHLQLVVGGKDVKLMVTSNGSLMPYGVDDIGQQLALVTDVYEKFLRQFEVGDQVLK